MALLFGKKKPAEKTVLILDIENGSIACALARLSPQGAPRLFAETRIALPMFQTFDGAILAREVEKTLQETLVHISTVAARIRQSEKVAEVGVISHVAVFLAPPWSTLHLQEEVLKWDGEPAMMAVVREIIESVLGVVPTSFFSLGAASAHGATTVFPEQEELLMCIMTGEVTEILLLRTEGLAGRVTVPMGIHTLLRTLRAHGGLSYAEAHSALHLGRQDSGHFAEPLATLSSHFGLQFKDAAQELLGGSVVDGILVVATEPTGEWFARSLSQNESVSGLFPEGGSVRALRTHHLLPHLSAHAAVPDLFLMLEAVFINNRLGGV